MPNAQQILSRDAPKNRSASKGIYFIHRKTGQITEETVFGRGFMEFFYGRRFGRLLTSLLLIRPWFSKVSGWYHDSSWSCRKIPGFIEKLSLSMEEVQGEIKDFKSFNEFFARRLKPKARPIVEAEPILVSPADARLLVFPKIDGLTLLPVKGAKIPLAKLLLDQAQAKRYKDGAALVFRLCPADYHRFHFPASGQASPPQSIPGRLHSVSPFAIEQNLDIFCRNHRVVSYLESERFGCLALIEIGALCVGAIVETYTPGTVKKGEEKGYFKFGGSSLVLLLEANQLDLDEDLINNTAQGFETLVQFGEQLGRAANPQEAQKNS